MPRQTGRRAVFLVLSLFLVLVLILILAIVPGNIGILGVGLPYLTFRKRYPMILLLGQGTCIHYDILRHMNGDEFSELCLCRATGREKTVKEFTQISRKKIIHSTILDTIQTIGTTIWCSVLWS